jgi:hypothetical protein
LPAWWLAVAEAVVDRHLVGMPVVVVAAAGAAL